MAHVLVFGSSNTMLLLLTSPRKLIKYNALIICNNKKGRARKDALKLSCMRASFFPYEHAESQAEGNARQQVHSAASVAAATAGSVMR
jgi:hypothetical protein